jgi:peptidoglycan/LPS O-acetylase OafA/YrhL
MTRTHSADPTPDADRGRHVPALDGVRGIAVLGVLLFHTDRLAGGFLGVDLFFALSGFLITGLLLREVRATGSVSLVAFWGRRVRRLGPALVLVLAVVTVLVWAVGPPDLVPTTLADGPWVQLNVINWHLLAESAGYWDRFGAQRVFGHLWSIAVEEQFYLGWPVLVLVVARWARRPQRWVAGVAGGLAVGSLVLMVVLVDPADPSRVYTGTDTRAFSLLVGAVAAVPAVADALVRAVGRAAGVVVAVLAVALGACWVLVDGVAAPWLFTGGLFAHSIAAAVLVALCAHGPGSVATRALAWAPLRGLGTISYSLYLWHWPVIVLLPPELTGLTGWGWTALVAGVSVALAAASTHLVENPVRSRAGWARGRTGAVVAAVVTVATASLWLLPAPAPPPVDVSRL